MYNIGQGVIITHSGKYKSAEIKGQKGIIKKLYTDKNTYGILIDGWYNSFSKEGLFWLSSDCFTISNNYKGDKNMKNELTGYEHVAIVNLVEDYHQKDYAFALYESEHRNLCFDGYVLVNPKNNITLAKVVRIERVEEYNSNIPITAEVVSACNMMDYYDRIVARKKEAERQQKEAQLRKKLDERISKLKDMEYYNRMAKEFADKDPEIASLVSELGTVVGE